MKKARWLLMMAMAPGCHVEAGDAVPGPQGPAGPGPTPVQIAAIELSVLAALQAQLTNPDCPAGYTRVADAPNPGNEASVECTKGQDHVVKVGTGGSAFWIDRFEAGLFDANGALLVPNPGSAAVAGLPPNGLWLDHATLPHAESRSGIQPTVNITWFQANEACRAGGKRLPTGSEWLAAATGTHDPGANNGLLNMNCNTDAGEPRNTGNTSCISNWGAEDMIGNLREWTDDWFVAVGDGTGPAQTPWPDDTYGGDGTWNIQSSVYPGGYVEAPHLQPYLPAAAYRGGDFADGPLAGIFNLNLADGPTSWWSTIGFRCLLPH